MNCGTCKHWGEYLDSPTNIKVGLCSRVPMFWDSTEWKDVGDDVIRVLTDEDNKAFVQDVSDYSAKLLTLAEFGCVQYDEAF